MKRLFVGLSLFSMLLLSQGCSVFLAASQPPKADVAAFAGGGVPRDVVVAKLGAPTYSEKHQDGTRTEVYEFYEGSAPGWKYGRAAFHAAADFFTLALWEVLATPAEMAIKGDKLSARAEFDQHDMLKEFHVIGTEQPIGKEKTPENGHREQS